MTQASAPERKPAPWRGRRRVNDPRDRFVAVRCTAAEHAAVTAASAQAGLDVGPYLRQLALGTAGVRTRRRPTAERQDLARLLAALGHLGANVNQLAKHANQTGDLPDRAALDRAVAAVEAMRDTMFAALGHGR